MTLPPSSTVNTSVESAPAKAGLCARKRSSASWDSVPGMLKSSAASPPAPAAAPSRTITITAPSEAALPVLGQGAGDAREQVRHARQASGRMRQNCKGCRFAMSATMSAEAAWTSASRPARAQAGADAAGDRGRRARPVRPPGLPRDDDPADRRGRRRLAAHRLGLLPGQGGPRVPRRRRADRRARASACARARPARPPPTRCARGCRRCVGADADRAAEHAPPARGDRRRRGAVRVRAPLPRSRAGRARRGVRRRPRARARTRSSRAWPPPRP